MKTLSLLLLASMLSLASFAQADDTVSGWQITCQGSEEQIQITQADDDALMSATGPLVLDNYDVGAPSSYSRNEKEITFSYGDVSLTVIRSNAAGVGTGEAYLKSSKLSAKLDCQIGFVPYEDGPVCFSAESLKNKDCQ